MSFPPVPTSVREAVQECIARFGENLRAVLWFGSTARGEGNVDSDEDLVLIFRAVDREVLSEVRSIFATDERREWSIDVRSDAEMRQLPYNRFYVIRFVFGFRVLYGAFEALALPSPALLDVLRDLVSDTSHICRNRFVEGRHPTKRLYGLAKRAVFAMRLRHLLVHGQWAETTAELACSIHDPEERTIVEWVTHWPDARSLFKEDPESVLLRIDALMQRVIALLPPAPYAEKSPG